MKAEQKRILVTGATGKIGRRVISELLPVARVRAYSRNVASAGLPSEVELVEGDLLDIQAVERALVDVDAVFLLWPFLSAEQASPVVQAIARHGKSVVYLSTAGAGDPADRGANPISAMHYAIERSIEEAVRAWTFVRPTSFASNVTMFWAGQIASSRSVAWPCPTARLSYIHDGDIASVVAKALVEESTNGRKLLLTGPEAISQADALQVIGRAVERSLSYNELSLEEARQQMLGWGMPGSIVEGVLGYWTKRETEPEPVNDVVAEFTGVRARPFSQWVTENLKSFQ